MSFRRDHHYVSCGYLKRWACADGKLWVYRTLVSRREVPLWKRVSPRGAAYRSSLYSRPIPGREVDEIEKWFDSEIEGPAEEPLQKATSDSRLTPDDWKCLLRFLAAQQVRTPARFEKQLKRWSEQMPGNIEQTLADSVSELERRHEAGEPPPDHEPLENVEAFPMRVSTRLEPGQEKGEVRVEAVAGRALWLWGMQHVLDRTWQALRKSKWTILHPPEGWSWFTSDDPVVCLNFNSLVDYNFDGGWANPGTEILLPIGPQHLMYAQVGRRPPQKGERMPEAQAEIVLRMIAEHAYRLIFANDPSPDIPRLRPRIEDAEAFSADSSRWANWEDDQDAAERDVLGWGAVEHEQG